MRLNYFYLLSASVILLLFCAGQASGQSATLTGTIADSLERLPLPGAHVRLSTLADSTVEETIVGEKGTFRFPGLPEGNYALTVHFLGFSPYARRVTIEGGNDRDLGTIFIRPAATELGAVEIVGKPLPVQVKGDTTEFNAGAFTTTPYADAEELVKKLPGIEVGTDGSVKSQGEDIQKVLVDGKEFFGDDPQIAMKNLPADIIDKIQIIDDQSEQSKFTGFDDGNRVKTMNIVTRPDRRMGYFGKINAGMGNADRYSVSGNFNYMNGDTRFSLIGMTNNVNQQNFSMQDIMGVMGGGGGGRGRSGRGGGRGWGRSNDFFIGNNSGNTVTNALGVNYNDKWLDKIDIRGSYFFNATDNSVSQLTDREYLIAGNASQLNRQDFDSESKNFNHRVNLRMEYEIDSMNSISFRPNISFQNFNRNRISLSETQLETGDFLNNSQSNSLSDNSGYRFNGELTYRHRFHKPGRTLSLNVDGSSNTNEAASNNYSLNEFFEDAGGSRLDTIDQLGNSVSGGWGFSSRLAYTEPIGTYSRLQANYSLRNTQSTSERETYDYIAATGRYDLLNTDLSNEFINDYIYHRAGLAYQYRKESFSFDLGLDFQSADQENRQLFPEEAVGRRSFSSWLPEANLSYEFTERKRLRLSYRTNTDPPSISQLQNVIDNSDPLNISSGNPDLEQALSHNFSLRYSSFEPETSRHLFAFISADLTGNRIVNSTFIASGDTTIAGNIVLGKGAQFTRPENVNGYYSLRSHFSYGMPIEALKLNLNLNTGFSHTHDIGLLNYGTIFSNSYGVNQGISINSNISEKINFGLGTNINYNIVRNNQQPELDNNYFSQNVSLSGTYIFWKGIRLSTDFTYNYNRGLSEGYDQDFLLWNASIAKKLLKDQSAEIVLSAYDILNSNTSIVRNVTERYIEDTQTNILRQYFLIGFNYNLRKFGGRSGGGGDGPGRRQIRMPRMGF